MTPLNIASVTSARPSASVGSRSGSESSTPVPDAATAASAAFRQPIRSATLPAQGPATPSSQSRKISALTALPKPNGGASSRYTTYEKTPTNVKKSAPPASAIRSSCPLRSWPRIPPPRRPLRAGAPTSGSERAMTRSPAAGSTASPPTAQRHPTAAASSATPTRPISPPATRAET